MKKSLGAQIVIYPYPVFLIGSYDSEHKANIMTASWCSVCCGNPPCMAVAIKTSAYTHSNILSTQAFTINVPSYEFISETDYAGVFSGKGEDKFERLGLTPVNSELVNAPYIDDFPLTMECQLMQHLPIGTHSQFIGEIVDVKADSNILKEDGQPDISKIKPFVFIADDMHYYLKLPLIE